MPVTTPGEARVLKKFPLSVGDLEWSHEAGGIIVTASVYVDERGAAESKNSMASTVARDAEKAEGGLNAVLFRRLPIREWDRWLDAKASRQPKIKTT